MALVDWTKTETIDVVVPLPPDAVRERLAAATNLTWIGGGTFQGTVGNGTFHLRLRKVQRRNLRPTLTGTFEAVPGGTRIRGECALPWWARPLGRATVVGAALGALGLLTTPLLAPDLEPALWAFWGFGLVMMPVVAVGIPGWLVSSAAEERTAVPAAVRALFGATAPEPQEALAREPAAEADRERRPRDREVER